jgi:hypothetical protein
MCYTPTNLTEHSEKLTVTLSPPFMEPEGSLPCLLEASTGP